MVKPKAGWKRGKTVKRKTAKKKPRRRSLGAKELGKRQRFQAQNMRDALEAAKAGIERAGGAARVRVALNRDGTVDGEVHVTEIPRSVSVRRMFVAIEEQTAWPANQWASHVIVFGLRPSEEHLNYKRRRGFPELAIVSTYPAHTTGNGMAKTFATAKDVADRIAKKKRKKPEELKTRLHWNQYGEKPKRRY